MAPTELLKKYAELHVSSLKEIKKFTCMFIEEDSGYKIIGTGVFIKFNDSHYILTAAHVLDEFARLKIPVDDGDYLLIPGGVSYTNNFFDKRAKDKVDIGFLKLDQESISDIEKNYDFLDQSQIELNHNYAQLPLYTYFGFPTTLSKYSKTRNNFHVIPFFHTTIPASMNIYDQLSRNPSQNIITSYNRKRAYNFKNKNLSNGPDLHGLSGCGLWYNDPMDLLQGICKPRLTAILTDWPVKNRNVVIGTNIDIIINSITTVSNRS